MIEVTASDRIYKVEMNSGSKNQYLNERRFVVVVPRVAFLRVRSVQF